MQKRLRLSAILIGLFALTIQAGEINLAGAWQFRMDRADLGVAEKWFTRLATETVRLPGAMAENGKGEAPSVETQWTGDILDRRWFTDSLYTPYRQPDNFKMVCWLTPEKYYVGAAWYQRQVQIPPDWQGQYIELYLERCHWESRVWVDDHEVGMRNSLATAHVYDLSQWLTPGSHRITIRIDNRIRDLNVGVNSHSISDHTQGNWNGIVGKMVLRRATPVFIIDLKLFPQVAAKSVKIRINLANRTGRVQKGELRLQAFSTNSAVPQAPAPSSLAFQIREPALALEIDYPMGEQVRLWDEFQPNLYQMTAAILGDKRFIHDSMTVQFGMRDFKTDGSQFTINGRKTFLRGTLECNIFPLTGYPPTDVASWRRIFAVCRDFGLNHMRFHSHCPPEAAFIAADEAGFYLHVECSSWANQGATLGDGKLLDQFILDESERIVHAYGNHPSFCLLLYGNEPAGDHSNEYLAKFVTDWKNRDPRRLYSSGAGWPILPETDFNSSYAPRIQLWGAGLGSIINAQPPQTGFDFRSQIATDKPTLSHEIGQWCVYPNFKEIPKYRGYLKAGNLEIFRNSLAQNHLGHLAEKFLLASGKLQTLCYKADIEAALRTPGLGGFQLLDLHDFSGQGTALVGVLDAFWDEKGYVTGPEYRQFCSSTVPLARLDKVWFLNSEDFSAALEVAHFGAEPMTFVTPEWQIRNSAGAMVYSGQLPEQNIPIGNAIALGRIEVPLSDIQTAQKLTLEVTLADFRNTWDFWVYPQALPEIKDRNILATQNVDEQMIRHLKKGGRVLLSLPKGSLKADKGGDIAIGFSSIFWNTAWTSNQPPHTLGILCDPAHPALAEFPTEYHSNLQWWDPIFHSQSMRLDRLPAGIEPIVRVIDDWFSNRPLALIFEANVLKGQVLVCSIDLGGDLSQRPVARQLRYSLSKYLASTAMAPKTTLTIEDLAGLIQPQEQGGDLK